MSTSTTRSTPEARFREWLRLRDQNLADQAREDIESREALAEGARHVNVSQFRALHNTAKMCGTVKELRGFIGKRAERRRASDQKNKADFWETLLSTLSAVQSDYADPGVEAAGVKPAISESIRNKQFDARTAHLLVARRYVEHFATHCQYVNRKDR